MGSPIYNPPVPYTGHIPGGFMPGRMVRVQGRVNSTANHFFINLQTGPNPYDDVALHVNPRLNENVIVRNAQSNSNWGPEERHGPPMSIYRDQSFEILILSEPSLFKIAVNGQHFTEFTHRIPIDRVTYVRVEGDLTISLIQFDGTVQATSAYAPSAPPPMGYTPGGGGGCPYPPASALPTPGFTMPVAAGVGAAAAAPYPASGGIPAPYPAPQQQPPYGGYPPSSGPSTGGYYPQQPAGYPTPGGQAGYYQPQGQHHGSGSSGGGLMSDASKLIAGGLAGVGLAKVANKIPGLGGGGHGHGHGMMGGGHGYPGYPHGGGGGGGGILGKAAGLLGPAAALGVGGALAGKKHKKNKNLLKYGVPIGGAVVGGYALKKGMKGFRGGSSSSSSSSSEEE